MGESKLKGIMKSLANARYNYNQSCDFPHDKYDYDDYDDVEHDFMTDEM